MKKMMMAIAVLEGMATGVSATTLTSIPVWSVAIDDSVGFRYRGQSTGNEHYAGVNDLGLGANRSEAGVNWNAGTYGFSFSFDSLTGAISSQLGTAAAVTYSTTAGFVSDFMVLTLFNQSRRTATMAVSDLVVNGENVGSLFCDAGSRCQWSLSDFTVDSVLDITGNLTIAGAFDSNDSERVKFEVTANTTEAVSAVPLPAAAWMLIAGLGGLVAMGRRRAA